jgi:hypothetical protein
MLIVVGSVAGLVVWLSRSGRGKTGKSPGAPAGQISAAEAGWREGRSLARTLAVNHLPMRRVLYAVVPRRGETAYLDLPVLYSRYGTWSRPGPRFSSRSYYLGGHGSCALAAATAINAICDTVQYRRDVADATPKWRGHEHTRVVLTNERVLVAASLPDGQPRWVSMDIDAITEFHPDLPRGLVEVRFVDAMPMQLEGPAIPSIAAWLGWTLYGPSGLRTHPGLRQLLD